MNRIDAEVLRDHLTAMMRDEKRLARELYPTNPVAGLDHAGAARGLNRVLILVAGGVGTMTTLRDEVAQAIWEVYRDADRDGPNPCEEAAEVALTVVRSRLEALPCDGKDSGFNYRYEALQVFEVES